MIDCFSHTDLLIFSLSDNSSAAKDVEVFRSFAETGKR
jgi:hypothetical protein